MCVCVLFQRCHRLWSSGAQCLSHLAMSDDDNDIVDNVLKTMTAADALFVRCELVSRGRQSLSSLNSTIEQFIHEASTTCR